MNIFRYLELNQKQYTLLVSLQNLLILNDILHTQSSEHSDAIQALVHKKKEWQLEWLNSTEASLKVALPKLTEREIVESFNILNADQKNLILLEAFSFIPYYPLSERGSGVPKKEAFSEEFRKEWEKRLAMFVGLSSTSPDVLRLIKCTYPDAVKGITGSEWSGLKRNLTIIVGAAVLVGITGGLAAPAVGGAIGGLMGLSGAAATSAGLAFLGGGALAAGGAGIAGGTAFFVGGSAILGGLVGSKFTNADNFDFHSTVAFDTNFLIVNSAKIETTLRIFVSEDDKTEFALKVIQNNKENLRHLDSLIQLGDNLKKSNPTLSLDIIKKNRTILANANERLLRIASGA